MRWGVALDGVRGVALRGGSLEVGRGPGRGSWRHRKVRQVGVVPEGRAGASITGLEKRAERIGPGRVAPTSMSLRMSQRPGFTI